MLACCLVHVMVVHIAPVFCKSVLQGSVGFTYVLYRTLLASYTVHNVLCLAIYLLCDLCCAIYGCCPDHLSLFHKRTSRTPFGTFVHPRKISFWSSRSQWGNLCSHNFFSNMFSRNESCINTRQEKLTYREFPYRTDRFFNSPLCYLTRLLNLNPVKQQSN